jgi:hypothetical protein
VTTQYSTEPDHVLVVTDIVTIGTGQYQQTDERNRAHLTN